MPMSKKPNTATEAQAQNAREHVENRYQLISGISAVTTFVFGYVTVGLVPAVMMAMVVSFIVWIYGVERAESVFFDTLNN
jgi:hypothetical protein